MGVTEWLQRTHKKRASQKKILAQALQRPMTGTELLTAMRQVNPKIKPREVTRLLRAFEKRKLIRCLTPKETESLFYFFTESGRRSMRKAFGFSIKPMPRLINWPKFAKVHRSQTRRLVLLELNALWFEKGKTVTTVRKQLNPKYRIGLNAVSHAMRELKELNLIKQIGHTKKRSRPIYSTTIVGKRIIKLLSAEKLESQSSDGKALLRSSPP